MDKEKFIKKAKEYGYSNKEIKEELEFYEESLREGFQTYNPMNHLVDFREETPGFPTQPMHELCYDCPHSFRYPDCPEYPDYLKCPYLNSQGKIEFYDDDDDDSIHKF